MFSTRERAPALELLADPAYETANKEFREALDDYRTGDLGDSLTKCGSAFESVLKILIARKGWPCQENDTAATLIRTVLANTTLDGYFESLLMIVPTLRNRLSSSHGAGTSSRTVSRHRVRYALNATAAAILLLVDEAEEGER